MVGEALIYQSQATLIKSSQFVEPTVLQDIPERRQWASQTPCIFTQKYFLLSEKNVLALSLHPIFLDGATIWIANPSIAPTQNSNRPNELLDINSLSRNCKVSRSSLVRNDNTPDELTTNR
jgi:hypothetical protein